MVDEVRKNSVFFKVSAFAAVPFFGFYTTKIGLSPIYFTFLTAFIFSVLGYLYGDNKLRLSSVVVAAVALINYLVIMLIFRWTNDGYENISAWINIVFSLLYLLVISLVFGNVKSPYLLKVTNFAICFSITLLFVEFVYRILNPSTQDELGYEVADEFLWYTYKTSSFMYPDSNSVGLFSACLFVFVLKVKRYYKVLWMYLIPIGLLLVGTLSRASIASTIFVSMLLLAEGRILKLGLSLLSVLAIIYGVYFVDINDESLSARFWIASLVTEYLRDGDFFSILFGVGPGNAEKVINVGAHLLPFTWLLELGFSGAFLQIILWYLIWRKAPKATGPLFLVFILNGLSFTTFAFPWFYVMTAILIYFSKEERGEK